MLTRAWLTRVSAELDAVVEDAGSHEAEVQAGPNAAEEERPDAVDEDGLKAAYQDRRESGHSGISGTTAKTSFTQFTQEELEELDATVIVDVLPDVSHAAERLVKLLLSPDPPKRPVVWKEIRTQGSRYNKLYKNRLASLNAHKESLGHQDFIRPDIVLRVLFGTNNVHDLPRAPWRPDSVLYHINLALMLRVVLVEIHDIVGITDQGLDALENMHTGFAMALNGPQFDIRSFDMMLQIQTQLCLAQLETKRVEPQFDAEAVIESVFWDAEAEDTPVYMWAEALQMSQLSAADRNTLNKVIDERIDNLKAPFEEDTPAEIAVRQLCGQFTWTHFVDHAIDYFEYRRAELDGQIAQAGGLDSIVHGLAEEVERREAARLAELRRQSSGQPGATPKKSAIATLKKREKRMSEVGVQPPAATAPQAPIAPAAPPMDPRLTAPERDTGAVNVRDDAAEPAQHDVEEEQAARGHALSALQLEQIQNIQRHNANKSKARFIDPQQNAVSLAFEESQEARASGSSYQAPAPASAPGPYHVASSAASRKRPYEPEEPEEFDPTQDGGFETDTRDTTAADDRRRTLQQHMPHQAARQRTAEPTPPGSAVPGPATQQSPSKRQRKNPGSAIPPPLPPLDAENEEANRADYFEHAKAMAKQSRVQAMPHRPVQCRQPWSREEENALLHLIETEGGEGVSYASLKRIEQGGANVLHSRSAEDMRFKARNMKHTMLA